MTTRTAARTDPSDRGAAPRTLLALVAPTVCLTLAGALVAPVAAARATAPTSSRLATTRDVRPTTAYALPASPGEVLHGFVAPARRWSAGHRGVDLQAAAGQAVLAPQSGVVAFTGTVAGRPVLTIRHDDGLLSSLEPVVAGRPVGARVARGDVVGMLADGRSGTPTAAGHCAPTSCLHWGVRDAPDSYVDPLGLVTPTGPVVLLPG